MKYLLTTFFLFSFFLIPSFIFSQVFTTDVIVQGSICIGLDCASSESFGFDTQRFKENNLRIKFDDTSNSASFPANDWGITINDSENGGNNYFGIDDVTAGTRPFTIEKAGNNALFIEDTGDIGIGTANPVVDLHVVEGNTPTLRLDQDGSDGFTSQTWDVAGNEANFFIRDVTNGSKLPFRIVPGAPTNSIFVNPNGNVTLGSNIDNDEKLTVKGNISTDGAIHFRTSNNDKYRFLVDASEASFNLQDASTGNNVVVVNEDAPENTIFIHDSGNISLGSAVENRKLYINGGLTVNGDIYCLSDRRLKSDISNIKYGLSDVLQLSAKQYTFNKENRENLNLASGVQLGLIAQEVESIIPEVVTSDFKVEGDDDQINTLKGVNYTALIPVLIQAIQEQQQQIEDKDIEITSIKTQLDQLSAKVDALLGHTKETNTQPQMGKILDSDNLQNKLEVISTPDVSPTVEQLNNGRSKSAVSQHKKSDNN